jgi:hypothetical protein
MKHKSYQSLGRATGRDETADKWQEIEDLNGWQGYEFWSLQLEALMDELDETPGPRANDGQAESYWIGGGELRDALPF